MHLKNKIAVITGGSRGIGLATAIALAEEGCKIAICSRSGAIEGDKRDWFAAKCDVSKSEDVKKFFSDIKKKFFGIDILVNNAGILVHKDFSDTSEQEWNDVIDVNLKGVMLCTQYALPLMNKGGMIINISSGAGKTGFGGMAAYCASKFGVIGFTESIAEELDGIKVYAVCPGGVDTKMFSLVSRHRPGLKPHHIAGKIVDICVSEPRPNVIEVYDIPQLIYFKAKRMIGTRLSRV